MRDFPHPPAPRFVNLFAVLALAAVVWASGCADPPAPAHIEVSPAAPSLASLGETVQLSVIVRDQYGAAMPEIPVTWSSAAAAVAVVDGAGLVTAVDNGTAVVWAAAAGLVASAAVTVRQEPDSVDVSPTGAVLAALGDTVRLMAVVLDANGHEIEAAGVTWSSADAAVVTVNPAGLVTAAADGWALVWAAARTADARRVAGRARVAVARTPVDVRVDPAGAVLAAFGDTVRLAAVAFDANGHEIEAAAFTWSSGSVAVAAVDATGLVTAVGNGSADVRASADIVSASAAVEVRQVADTVDVWPPDTDTLPTEDGLDRCGRTGNASPAWFCDLHALGDTVRLAAAAFDANGHEIEDPAFTWSSTSRPHWSATDTLTAVVDSTGLVTVVGNGAAVVWASADGVSDSVAVGVWQKPDSLEVSPRTATLAPGDTVRLEVVAAFDANGHRAENFSAEWQSSDVAVAGVSGWLPRGVDRHARVVTAKCPGRTGITARVNNTDPTVPPLASTTAIIDVAGGDPCMLADAYLVQNVQARSEDEAVPLVAGERALLRVFLTAARETDERLPDVRARFYLGGREVGLIDIPGTAAAIPAVVDEGDLAKSVNAEVPGEIVQPGLEMVIEADPVDPSLGVPVRIPAEGRLAVPVVAVPTMHLTAIPFLWAEDPDSVIIPIVEGMAGPDDPDGWSSLLRKTRTLLPVGALEVAAHEPVTIDSNDSHVVLDATGAIRAAEGGGGYWMGMMRRFHYWGGRAWVGGWTSVSVDSESTIAHELGHNMNLWHAPSPTCLHLPSNVDPAYPDEWGRIGLYGYEFDTTRSPARIIPPYFKDLMGYCGLDWISGYHFRRALDWRLPAEGPEAPPARAAVPSLLLWGGSDPDGRPRLHPAFVVDAPPALPPAGGGDHVLRGFDDAGAELFALRFDMAGIADGDGGSAFVFALPADPGWAGVLARLTLSGPGGSVTLDGSTHRPSVLARDPESGQVRSLLLNLPGDIRTAEDAAALMRVGPGAHLRFSRGVPDAAAWRR